MAHEWPKAYLYAFPMLHLFLAVLWRVRKNKVRLLLVAAFGPSYMVLRSDLSSGGTSLENPNHRQSLSCSRLAMALLSRDMETMGLACEQGILMNSGLSSDITQIILNASVTDL